MSYECLKDLEVYDGPGNGEKTLGIPVSSVRLNQYRELVEWFKKRNISIIKNVRLSIYSELDHLQSLKDRIE